MRALLAICMLFISMMAENKAFAQGFGRGYRCNAIVQTPFGPQAVLCNLPYGPLPLNTACACYPPPPNQPGRGRVVP